MKKSLITALITAVLSSSMAYALPINASGAGGTINIENSTVISAVRSSNDTNTEICANGHGICNIAGNQKFSGSGASVNVTNSQIISTVQSSNGTNNKICTSAVCNLGK